MYSEDIAARTRQRLNLMKTHGFFLDCFFAKEGMTIEEVIKSRTLRNGDAYKVAFEYDGPDGLRHYFVYVEPRYFSFHLVNTYDLSPMYGNGSELPPVLHSFCGIYVKSSRLKIHDLIQFDPSLDAFLIRNYNLGYKEDGDILPHKSPLTRGLWSDAHDSGGVYMSFEEYRRAFLANFAAKYRQVDDKINEYETALPKLRAERESLGRKRSMLEEYFSKIITPMGI